MKKSVLNGKSTLNNADDLISIVSKKLNMEEIRTLKHVNINNIEIKYNPRKKTRCEIPYITGPPTAINIGLS